MQRDMINEIEAARPEYIVVVNVRYSWLARPHSDLTILDWFKTTYGPKNYQVVGLIDISTDGQSIYHWDEKAVAVSPRSQNFVRVFRRNDLF